MASNISKFISRQVVIDNDLAPKVNELILFLSMLLDIGREEGIGTRDCGWDIEEEVSLLH